MKKTDDGPPEHLTEEESLQLEWSIFDFKPMRIGLNSSLETHLEDFSVLDTDDNRRLCDTLILIQNIIVVGTKAAPPEEQFNCQETFPFLSKCFSNITKEIIKNKQVRLNVTFLVQLSAEWTISMISFQTLKGFHASKEFFKKV